ncbi:hypothetical protein D9M68_239920 [compost metagenome]
MRPCWAHIKNAVQFLTERLYPPQEGVQHASRRESCARGIGAQDLGPAAGIVTASSKVLPADMPRMHAEAALGGGLDCRRELLAFMPAGN